MFKKILSIVLVGALLVVICNETFGVPASPFVHTLSQPDGPTFKAIQWGDENIHGWETEDGYTIIFDESFGWWTYADLTSDGSLISSGLLVGKDTPPANVKRHIRPEGEALARIPLKRHSRELKALRSSGKDKISLQTGISEPVVPPTGTGNIPVILVNFSDTSITYTTSDFHNLLFGTGNYSMKDYYEEVSYGAFSVSPGPQGVAGWYMALNTHNYYGADVIGDGDDAWPGDLVYEGVTAADSAGFNFAPYDQDGDCFVDVVAIVHQGAGQEASGNSTDIWSHRWSLNGASYWGRSHYGIYTTNDPCPSGGYIKVNDYIIQPEKLWSGITTMGVFAHEYGHALGLPDLYDTDYSSRGVGRWSLMAGGSWNYVTMYGDRPAHLDAWSKYFLGWVTPTEVSGTLYNEPITQASTTSDVYKLLSGSPDSGEYFLVENRQKTGFDAGLPGAGLLIWHIDAGVTNNNNECYPGGPSCASAHYMVALIQADSLYQLEKDLNSGDTGDPYPGYTNNTTFNASSSPDSNLYSGAASGVSVTNISPSGPTITATLTAPGETLTLTVTKSGTGSGTVTSNPSGINCGTDCNENYSSGTVVTLTATPASGSIFAGWSGDTDCSDGQVTMDSNKTCTATFNLTTTTPDITVTPTSYDFGTVTVGTDSLPQTFTIINTGTGNLVIDTINLTGSNPSHFRIQDDNCSSQSITPLGNCTVEAIFSPLSGGNKSANLSIPSNDADTPTLDASVSGTGQLCNVTFNDIPSGYWAEGFIKTLYCNGITGGCSTNPLNYCPDNIVTRAQMAVFIIQSMVEAGLLESDFAYNPTPYFLDVPSSHWAFKYIQKMKELNITGGCTQSTYCPDGAVTRAQMAVFMTVALGEAPSTSCAAMFNDVNAGTVGETFCRYIEKFATLGITSGCSVNPPLYCPNSSVTRAQMAVFIKAGFLN